MGQRLLQDLPPGRSIFLNDLQGAPAACGCGHQLCRWTTDYGPIRTATRLSDDGAAKFVAAVKQLAPASKVVPVWTTECEEADKETLCGGVGCFNGACWREFTKQLTPLAVEAENIGALLTYRAFQRDLPRYGPPAGWVNHALRSFTEMPARYEAKGVAPERLIAVLQGWDVSPEQIKAQISRVREARAAGYIVSMMKIEQDWEPRMVKAPKLQPAP